MGTLTINGLKILEILPLNSNINYINEKKKLLPNKNLHQFTSIAAGLFIDITFGYK